jgi:glycerol-3-phosphate dehydrogenase
MNGLQETQILIIGAGTTGLGIARELSKYELDTTVVDKNGDLCSGGTKASYGQIYSSIGLMAADSLFLKSAMTPGMQPQELFHSQSLKTKLTREGFGVFPAFVRELDIDLVMQKKILVGKDDHDRKALNVIEEICKSMEIEPEKLDRDTIQAYEPHLSGSLRYGLAMDKDVGMLYPWELGIALAENASQNGVRIQLSTQVLDFHTRNNGFLVQTTRGPIRAEFVINAAGLLADRIAEMAGVGDFRLSYFCNQGLIADKRLSHFLTHHVSFASQPGLPRGLMKSPSGNIIVACSGFHPVSEYVDASMPSRHEWIRESIDRCQEILPSISERDFITGFSGLYQINTRDPEDHLLEVSRGHTRFVNAVVRMPGLALIPAMGQYISALLTDQGLSLTRKRDFNPYRPRIPKASHLSDEERSQLLAKDSRYSRIVCRCEEVSEGEIAEAIKRGARTIAGIKYRTRAGMGRCQANYCTPRIIEILSRELDVPIENLAMKGLDSRVFLS